MEKPERSVYGPTRYTGDHRRWPDAWSDGSRMRGSKWLTRDDLDNGIIGVAPGFVRTHLGINDETAATAVTFAINDWLQRPVHTPTEYEAEATIINLLDAAVDEQDRQGAVVQTEST